MERGKCVYRQLLAIGLYPLANANTKERTKYKSESLRIRFCIYL